LIYFQGLIVNFEKMPDQRLLAFYESIRQQAEADRPYKHRVTDGPTVRQYADQLRHEIIKRRLNHPPIDWSS
jgi:hypothetical protein